MWGLCSINREIKKSEKKEEIAYTLYKYLLVDIEKISLDE